MRETVELYRARSTSEVPERRHHAQRGIQREIALRVGDRVDTDEGYYTGRGPGQYSTLQTLDVTTGLSCSSRSERTTVAGTTDVTVYALFTIDNSVVGGRDTSDMPSDTTVVEAMFEGHELHQDNYTHIGCDPANEWSSDDASAGLACHFYGVDLYRGGFYENRLHDDPAAICTLQLSR